MSYSASVVDGKVVQQSTKTASATDNAKKNSNSLDKDAFLQLLVAEMKYQDPLEASNNSTEYISQLATFSELEGMQNLQDTAEDMKASDLIGKTVVLNVDDNLITGQVDFLKFEDGKTKISVNGNYYDLDDVYQVLDGEYLSAYTKASNLIAAVVKLPELDNVTSKDLDAIKEIKETYEGMSQYEVSFVADEAGKTIEKYIEKYKELGGDDRPEQTAEDVIIDKLESYEKKLEELLQKLVDEGKESKAEDKEDQKKEND